MPFRSTPYFLPGFFNQVFRCLFLPINSFFKSASKDFVGMSCSLKTFFFSSEKRTSKRFLSSCIFPQSSPGKTLLELFWVLFIILRNTNILSLIGNHKNKTSKKLNILYLGTFLQHIADQNFKFHFLQ